MSRRTKLLVALALAGAATAAAATIPPALAGRTASYQQDIYAITVDAQGRQIPEWVSLASGTWRLDAEGQTFISSDDSYVVVDEDSGSVYHRTGSRAFMGDLHAAPDGVLALRAQLRNDPTLASRGWHVAAGTKNGKTVLDVSDASGNHVLTVTVDARVSDQDAAAAHLLDVNPVRPEETDTEVAVGAAPANGVAAYWLGRSVGAWHAAAAAEHSRVRSAAQLAAGMPARGEVQAYVTFYEQPGIQATGAQPGLLARPAGELQVSSEPLASAHAQGLVDAMNGRNGDETYPAWPRSTVTLASGERVTVVPSLFDGDGPVRNAFFVLTGTTLVSVSGEVPLADIPGLAARLQPVR